MTLYEKLQNKCAEGFAEGSDLPAEDVKKILKKTIT